MFKYTSREVSSLADDLNFNKNTTEKVLRLYSVLRFINEGEIGEMLALKGGTAINLFLLSMPRLSVDIDLDFTLPVSREEMLAKREHISKLIRGYMNEEGYMLSDKSKFTHSLDSYVYTYNTTSGSRDLLKIEINYSDRVHVLKPVKGQSVILKNESAFVMHLAIDELIGSKINALVVRTTPRDVYDVYNLFLNGYIQNKNLIRKITVFYVCLGSEIPVDFEDLKSKAFRNIKELKYQKIKETLVPVLHKGIHIEVEEMTESVVQYLEDFLILDENDQKFIEEFNHKNFRPDILFEGTDALNVMNHPMGLWKTR